MNALSQMAQVLERARPASPLESATSRSGQLRAALRDGPASALELELRTGIPAYRVSGLLKHAIALGGARFINGQYELTERRIAPTNTFPWIDATKKLPDADLTVMIEIDPAFDYSEPVFMGYYDGDGVWRDVHGVEVKVIAWAEPPVGSRAQ